MKKQAKAKTRFVVRFGKSSRVFYSARHVEQFASALRLNRTEYTVAEESFDAMVARAKGRA